MHYYKVSVSQRHQDKQSTSISQHQQLIGGKAPFKMYMGAAAVDGDVAYFMHTYFGQA